MRVRQAEKSSQGGEVPGRGSQVWRMRGTGVLVLGTRAAPMPAVGEGLIGKSPSGRVPYCPAKPQVGLTVPPTPIHVQRSSQVLVCREGPSSPFMRQPGEERGTQRPSHRGAFLLCSISLSVKWRPSTPLRL